MVVNLTIGWRLDTSPLDSSQSRAGALVDDVEHLLALGRPRQVLVPVLGDEDVVLDPHTAHVPVPAQRLLIDVLGVDGVPEEVALDVLAAEVAGRVSVKLRNEERERKR